MGGKPRIPRRAHRNVRAAVSTQLVQATELADLLFARYDLARFDVALLAIADCADAIANDYSGSKLIEQLVETFLSESIHFIQRDAVLAKRLALLKKAIERWEPNPDDGRIAALPTLAKPSTG